MRASLEPECWTVQWVIIHCLLMEVLIALSWLLLIWYNFLSGSWLKGLFVICFAGLYQFITKKTLWSEHSFACMHPRRQNYKCINMLCLLGLLYNCYVYTVLHTLYSLLNSYTMNDLVMHFKYTWLYWSLPRIPRVFCALITHLSPMHRAFSQFAIIFSLSWNIILKHHITRFTCISDTYLI